MRCAGYCDSYICQVIVFEVMVQQSRAYYKRNNNGRISNCSRESLNYCSSIPKQENKFHHACVIASRHPISSKRKRKYKMLPHFFLFLAAVWPLSVIPIFFRQSGQYHLVVLPGGSLSPTHSRWN